MRVGVQIRPQHADYPAMRTAWQAAEEIGVDTLWNWDHFFPLSGDPDGEHFECFSLLAAMAEVTERVEFGPLVACNSYRNPHLMADMARTIDHISGGRFILALGAGWFRRDYQEYGYRFGTAGERLRALEQGLEAIEHRLAHLNPPPRRPIPLMVGGGGEKVTLRIVAERADIWNGFGPPEQFRHKNQVLDEWCEKVGRDPSEIERSAAIQPGEVERADRFVEAGAQHLIVGLDPTADLGPVRDLVAWRDDRS